MALLSEPTVYSLYCAMISHQAADWPVTILFRVIPCSVLLQAISQLSTETLSWHVNAVPKISV